MFLAALFSVLASPNTGLKPLREAKAQVQRTADGGAGCPRVQGGHHRVRPADFVIPAAVAEGAAGHGGGGVRQGKREDE